MHAGGGFLGHADEVGHHAGPAGRILLVNTAKQVLDDGFFGAVRGRIDPAVAVLEFVSLVDEQGRVTTVVDDELGSLVTVVGQGVIGAIPVFLEAHALPSEHRRAACRNGRSSVVLGGEDVAARPADFSPKLDQRFDEHRGLNGHVQGASDADAFERTLGCVAGTDGHEARHFMLSDADFKPAKVREGFVGDQIRGRRGAGLHGLGAQPCLKRLPLAP